MGSCEGISSTLHRPRYISWCVDSAEPPAPAALRETEVAPEESFHVNSVPLLLLSPPETCGGEANTACSHRRPEPTLTERTRPKACTRSPPSRLSPQGSSAVHSTDRTPNPLADDGEEDDDGEEGIKGISEELEDRCFFLPRSSPVISRRHRPVSWHGEGTGMSAPPSNIVSRSLASAPLSLDPDGCPAVPSMVDLGSRPSSCPHLSPPSHLNRLLGPWVNCLFSGQQGLAKEERGRALTSCEAYHPSGLSSATVQSKERIRCRGIPNFFKTSCDLEKENAHFIVVDMTLEVLEGVKWTLSSDRWTSETDTRRQRSRCNVCTRRDASSAEDMPSRGHKDGRRAARGPRAGRASDARQETDNTSNTHTRHHTRDEDQEEEEEEEEEEEDAVNPKAEHPPETFSILSSDSGFEDCGVDTTLTTRTSLPNAEWLAQQLVLGFRRSWLPSHEPRRARQSLRSSLQELPGTGDVAVSSSSLAEEIRLRTRMRGSLSWAPPRFQIIFTVQPTSRRSEVVALQHFLCAGCGTEVEPRYIKKLRYCEYLGRYFCDCCHGGSEAVIPGRLLSCWDFGRYPVSDFSKQLLDSVWRQPLFDLSCVGKTLYSSVKELDKFRELQEQLIGIKKLLSACRLSRRVMSEFDQLPAHLMEQPPLFSMEDLWRVKKGLLVVPARALLHSAIEHVENCELCLARGFICEFCRERDVIFPFQVDICRRCPACRACFHKHCFVQKKCPKCARIQSRKNRPDGSHEETTQHKPL